MNERYDSAALQPGRSKRLLPGNSRLGALDLSTVDSDMSTALAPEQPFVDHRCRARKERILPRPIELSERKRRVRVEAARGEFTDKLRLSQKALWLSGELCEHEGLTRQRFRRICECAPRERKQKQRTSRSPYAPPLGPPVETLRPIARGSRCRAQR